MSDFLQRRQARWAGQAEQAAARENHDWRFKELLEDERPDPVDQQISRAAFDAACAAWDHDDRFESREAAILRCLRAAVRAGLDLHSNNGGE